MTRNITLSPLCDFLFDGNPITEAEAIRIWNDDELDVYWNNDAMVEVSCRINGYYNEYEEDV